MATVSDSEDIGRGGNSRLPSDSKYNSAHVDFDCLIWGELEEPELELEPGGARARAGEWDWDWEWEWD